jgi:hypothetical membrane protein
VSDAAATSRYRLGGLLLLLALTYFVGEAWAATGWQGRPYHWTIDAISELGVPEVRHDGTGPFVSTRQAVMNATFVGTGVRVLLVAAVLAPFVPRRARRTVLILAALHGVGLLLVGFFPIGPGLRAAMHGIGALLTIAGGSALLVALTISMWGRCPRLARVTAVLAVLSVIGSACGVAAIGGFGLVERLTVYTVVLWQVIAGVVVLTGRPVSRADRPDRPVNPTSTART